jgi:hypothetical protein
VIPEKGLIKVEPKEAKKVRNLQGTSCGALELILHVMESSTYSSFQKSLSVTSSVYWPFAHLNVTTLPEQVHRAIPSAPVVLL